MCDVKIAVHMCVFERDIAHIYVQESACIGESSNVQKS